MHRPMTILTGLALLCCAACSTNNRPAHAGDSGSSSGADHGLKSDGALPGGDRGSQEQGAATDASGPGTWQVGWVRQTPGVGTFASSNAHGVASDNVGNVYLAGYFQKETDFGGQTVKSQGGYADAFLASYDRTGKHRWSKGFGGTNDDRALAVGADSKGTVTVTGFIRSPTDFGGGPVASVSYPGIFVATFDNAGKHQWSTALGDGAGKGVSRDAAGNVLVTGYCRGWVTFAGMAKKEACNSGIFLVKLDGKGKVLWYRVFKSTNSFFSNAVGTDAQGNAVITGSVYAPAVDLGGGILQTNKTGYNYFLAKYDASGKHVWSSAFASGLGEGVTMDSAGNVVLAGSFSKTTSLGGAPLTSAGDWDIFLARFSSGGKHLWSKRFGGNKADRAAGLTVDIAGRIYLAAKFTGPINFGGGLLGSIYDRDDMLVAGYSAAGAHILSKRFNGNFSKYGSCFAHARGISVTPSGSVLLAGDYNGTLEVSGKPYKSVGGSNAVVISLSATP